MNREWTWMEVLDFLFFLFCAIPLPLILLYLLAHLSQAIGLR